MIRYLFLCYVVLFGYSFGAVSAGLLLQRVRQDPTKPALLDTAMVVILATAACVYRAQGATFGHAAGIAIAAGILFGGMLRARRPREGGHKVLPQ